MQQDNHKTPGGCISKKAEVRASALQKSDKKKPMQFRTFHFFQIQELIFDIIPTITGIPR